MTKGQARLAGAQHLRVVAAGALIVALSSCQGVLTALGVKSGPRVRVAASSMPVTAGAPATAAGRVALDADQPGAAIEAFQTALSTGEPLAPALNGLGVAYARLGRPDLAERFFREAVALAPGDERFAANLSRLSRSTLFAERHRDAEAAALAAAVAAAGPAGEGSRPVAVGQIERVSRGEVRIRTLSPLPAPSRATAALAPGFRPELRVPLGSAARPAETAVAAAEEIRSSPATVAFQPKVRVALHSAGAAPATQSPVAGTATASARIERVSRGEVRLVVGASGGPSRAQIPAPRLAMTRVAAPVQPAPREENRP